MFKFFRRIRYDLLKKKLTSGEDSAKRTGKIANPASQRWRYFKYAIGEIVLVVIGILIALAINNWNIARIDITKQLYYLTGLNNDLEKQIVLFEAVEDRYTGLIDKAEILLSNYDSLGNLVEIDSLNKKLSNLMYIEKYPIISTTFSELNSTGHLDLIKNKELRTHVIEYYQNSAQHQQSVDGNTDDLVQNQILPTLASIIVFRQDNFGKSSQKEIKLNRLKSFFKSNLKDRGVEFELVNAINLGIIVNKYNLLEIEEAKEEAELLLDQIVNELKVTYGN